MGHTRSCTDQVRRRSILFIYLLRILPYATHAQRTVAISLVFGIASADRNLTEIQRRPGMTQILAGFSLANTFVGGAGE